MMYSTIESGHFAITRPLCNSLFTVLPQDPLQSFEKSDTIAAAVCTGFPSGSLFFTAVLRNSFEMTAEFFRKTAKYFGTGGTHHE